jgi:circadian clock protein KaiB
MKKKANPKPVRTKRGSAVSPRKVATARKGTTPRKEATRERGTTMRKGTISAQSAAKPGASGPLIAAQRIAPSAASAMESKTFTEVHDDQWDFCLYIAGETPRSVAAQANLTRLCEKYLPKRCNIRIIDLVEHPELARLDQILAIPTVVRRIPIPVKRIIGDLSDEDRAMLALDVRRI